ncbi:MAG: penicillin-binding protein 2 [Lachnospiraceae bacterium]|nr:penicillin-binding protein 2 [Lachnospiraceae bacterium]
MEGQIREKKKDKTKKMTQKMQTWTLVVFCVFLFALIGLIARIYYITTKDNYRKNALEQQSFISSVIPAKRGTITDRNGIVLAQSKLVYNLILDPKVLLTKEKYVDPTVKALIDVYGFDEKEIRNILTTKSNSSYVVLSKGLSYADKEKFQKYIEDQGKEGNNIKGVWYEEEYIRNYPLSSLASHLIGFTTSDGTGTYGIEQAYNDSLIGETGRTYGYYDSELNITRVTKDAVDGNCVISTVDANVQRVVQKYVENFLNETGAENIGVIMMDASNGEILAMQSNDSYNLNSPRDLSAVYTEEEIASMDDKAKVNALYDMWRNYCVSDAYEPGSTFKPFTVASALEENVISTTDTFICDGSETFPGGTVIKCSNKYGHGELTLAQTLMLSCNDGLMQIAAKLGRNRFATYQDHFRFGLKTGIDLPGETAGELISESNLNVTELATSSFGQSFTSSMVQMASAFASLINGGEYYAPHVVKAITDSDGNVVSEYKPLLVQKTVSEEVSEYIKETMILTVEAGTAKKAAVKGYIIGGKTGTAQKYPRADKKYLVSFLGFVQAEDREIVIYVVVDEAHDEKKMSTSATALNLAAEILEEAMPYLKVYPSGNIDYHMDTIDKKEIIADILKNPAYNPDYDESDPDLITE